MFVRHKLYQTVYHRKITNISTVFLIKTKKQSLFVIIVWVILLSTSIKREINYSNWVSESVITIHFFRCFTTSGYSNSTITLCCPSHLGFIR